MSGSTSVFYDVDKTNCILYVPVGSESAYLAADQWKDFQNILEHTTGLSTQNKQTIKLYPNPFTEGISISGIDGFTTIKVYDLNGKVLFSEQGFSNKYYSLKALTNGIYLVKINSKNCTLVKKMVKQ